VIAPIRRSQAAAKVSVTSKKDVGNPGLMLKDGSHCGRQFRVEIDDGLIFVKDERDANVSLASNLAGKLEQPLDRRLDVGFGRARGELDAHRAFRANRELWPQWKTGKELGHSGPSPRQGRNQAGIDGVSEDGGQAIECGGAQKVDIGVKDRIAWQPVKCFQDERGFSVPARRDYHDVLAATNVQIQLGHFTSAAGEIGPAHDLAEPERILHVGLISSTVVLYKSV
jgi:hypothetical protein